MLKRNREKNKKGFSLVELVVVIGIMAVLLAILTPSLLMYTEKSRAQRDDSAMDEVVEAVQLAMSDQKCYDEMLRYSCTNNYITYTDSSGNYGQKINDAEFWAPDGSGMATTITFNPIGGALGKTYYSLDSAIVNDMTYNNGSSGEQRTMEGALIDNNQCYLKNASIKDSGSATAYLYNRVRQVIGDDVLVASATYRNSSYTIFIKFNQKDGVIVADVSGSFNGTNLHERAPVSLGSGTSSYDDLGQPETDDNPGGLKPTPVFNQSDLTGSGSFGGSVTPDYKTEVGDNGGGGDLTDTSGPIITIDRKLGENSDNPTPVDSSTLALSGAVTDDSGVSSLVINSVNVDVDNDGIWSTTLTLTKDVVAELKFVATDNNGNITEKIVYVLYGTFIDVSVGKGSYAAEIGYSDTITNLDIPAIFKSNEKWYRVTGLKSDAFSNCKNLESVKIPDSITSITSNSFYGCSALTSVSIPDGITIIGSGAFEGCSSLTSVVIPDTVTTIYGSAFKDCKKLTSVNIPDGVTNIGYRLFYGCSSLDGVVIPESVTKINKEAFRGCRALTSINIPKGITQIGHKAFMECTGLKCAYADNLESWCQIGFDSLESNPAAVADKLCINGVEVENVVIPSSITKIKDYTFASLDNLTSVVINNNVTHIGKGAFIACRALTTIDIPDSVEVIGIDAFNHCENLTLESLPAGLTSIGDSAFWGCTKITLKSIPDGVTSIGSYAFCECANIVLTSLPAELTSIGKMAFSSCSGIKKIKFDNPNGWYVTNTKGAASGTNIDVTIEVTNATNLRSNYDDYYWYRSK